MDAIAIQEATRKAIVDNLIKHRLVLDKGGLEAEAKGNHDEMMFFAHMAGAFVVAAKIASRTYLPPVDETPLREKIAELEDALTGLLGTTELNMDDLEGDTRYQIENAWAVIQEVKGGAA